MRLLLLIISAMLIGAPALAGDLTVQVRDGAGQPVPDAVVTVHPNAGVPARPQCAEMPFADMMAR